MSKMENKWDYLSKYEKQKAYNDLNKLFQIRAQKQQINGFSIQERIEKIKRDFPKVRI